MTIKKDKMFKSSYKLKFALIAVLMIFVAGLVSYGAFFATGVQTGQNVISSSCFSSSFTDGESINLTSALPLTDEEGLETDPYTFTIENTCNISSIYYILINTKNNNFYNGGVSLSLDGNTSKSVSSYQSNTKFTKDDYYDYSYIVGNGYLANGESATHDIRIWMNSSATYTEGMTWEGEIKVVSVVAELEATNLAKSDYAPDFKTDSSGANTPNLVSNLIPVVYDEENDQWVKASSDQSGWYNYDEQIWANAVTTTTDNRALYNAAPTGTIIPMDEILGMYVWIPRYEYNYTNMGTNYAGGTAELPGGIGINFISGTSTTESTNYIIHPAFRNGSVTYTNNAYTTTSAYQMGGWDRELTGFWYAKFETAGTDVAPTSKPDLTSLVNQTISAQFETASKTSTYHGVNLESHMSKNSEWGAVTYLMQSTYGKYGNDNYTGIDKEVYINVQQTTGMSYGSNAEGLAGATLRYNDTHVTRWKTQYEGAEITNDATYPWTDTDGLFKSTTQDKNSTTTNLQIKFTLDTSTTVTFDWAVSSESASYDYLYYTFVEDGVGTITGGTSTKIGGTTMGTTDAGMTYTTVSNTLDAGDYSLTFTYRKDGSVKSGTDTAYVKNISILGTRSEGEFPDVINGVGASTTGNIYGIYDMNGGASENLMANYNNTLFETDGFTTLPNQKYYDLYTASGTYVGACSGLDCYGHAVTEVEGWYGDIIEPPGGLMPWVNKWSSAGYMQSSGIWQTTFSGGTASTSEGFRIVLK